MNIQAHRKDEHVIIAEKLYSQNSFNQLDQIQLLVNNLPEISKDEVSLDTTIMGYNTSSPFFINAITGGSAQTDKINLQLASVANQCHIPFATGSASIALKNSESANGFKKLRKLTADTLIFTNLGAGNDSNAAKAIMQLTNADGLQIHLNVAQELVMPEGDRSFYWQKNIAQIVQNLNKPVMVKEVGQGLSSQTLDALKTLNVKYIDLAAKGGTNFVKIENERRHPHDYSFLSEIGLSLAQNLIIAQNYRTNYSITASGGIRNALEIIKCLILGVDNVGISGMFLHTLIQHGTEGLLFEIESLTDKIKDIMTLLGCKTISELRNVPYVLSTDLMNFKNQITK